MSERSQKNIRMELEKLSEKSQKNDRMESEKYKNGVRKISEVCTEIVVLINIHPLCWHICHQVHTLIAQKEDGLISGRKLSDIRLITVSSSVKILAKKC